jgi:lipoate-protein ligase A
VRWRLLSTSALGGPDNMALDEALMTRARRTGETVLRVYAWSAPTLSLGRNQRALGLYDSDALARAGVDVLRRPTGGRALLHHREVTYSVTAPVRSDESITAAYGRVNALLATALESLGVPATIAAPSERALSPTGLPCFAEPARGELVLDGRKLVGSAQWRDDGAMLQHGSILIDDDQALISVLMCEPPALAGSPPATLRGVLGRTPALEEVAEAMARAVRLLADSAAMPLEIDAETQNCAQELASRYRDPAWTWRR